MKALLSILVLSLVALPSFATVVTTHPIAPTSHDRIDVRFTVTCGLTEATVTRNDNVIRIVYKDLGAVCSPPVQLIASVVLDPLPAGTYRINTVPSGSEEPVSHFDLVVRNATPELLVARPFAVNAVEQDPDELVRVHRIDGKPICSNDPCTRVELRVGGVSVPFEADAFGGASFLPPPHEAGFVDIALVTGDTTVVTRGALYYALSFAPFVERVLFPVLDTVDGVGGSRWVTEVMLSNPNRWAVNSVPIFPVDCVTDPCLDRLAPGSFLSFEGFGYPRGVALVLPRGDADLLSFSVRVRDTSRIAQGLGTRIPVVRERDMLRNAPVTLLDVPREPKYRVKVRYYALSPFVEETPRGILTIIDHETGTRTEQEVLFTLPEDDPENMQPAFAEIDFFDGTPGRRISLYLEGPEESFVWGFATVTNNETQQVTIVTPDGRGEVPCADCREP